MNFSDNCCATLKPTIRFRNNRLVFLPYEKYTGDYCGCNCCFTISYEISGLTGKKYQTYFQGSEVTLSDNYYDTVKPSFKTYNGATINRINKYGFKEGLWMWFYEDGKKELVSQYPDQSLFNDPFFPVWSKRYYPSGQLTFYERKDTSESWFEDGETESQLIKYKVGDTAFEKGFRKFDNRLLSEEHFEKFYPTVFKSEFDPEYKGEGAMTETVYRRNYYPNGKPKFLFTIDTSYSWFQTGRIESKRFKSGEIQFDSGGKVTERMFLWIEKGPKHWRNLDNALYVRFYANGNIKNIELARDEPTHDGIAPSVRYDWSWDERMNLIEFPKGWKEPFPWERFPEIERPIKTHKGLKSYTKPVTGYP